MEGKSVVSKARHQIPSNALNAMSLPYRVFETGFWNRFFFHKFIKFETWFLNFEKQVLNAGFNMQGWINRLIKNVNILVWNLFEHKYMLTSASYFLLINEFTNDFGTSLFQRIISSISSNFVVKTRGRLYDPSVNIP